MLFPLHYHCHNKMDQNFFPLSSWHSPSLRLLSYYIFPSLYSLLLVIRFYRKEKNITWICIQIKKDINENIIPLMSQHFCQSIDQVSFCYIRISDPKLLSNMHNRWLI